MDHIDRYKEYCCCDRIPYFYNRFIRWFVTLIGIIVIICLLPVISLIGLRGPGGSNDHNCTINSPFMGNIMCYLIGLFYMILACMILMVLGKLISILIEFITGYDRSVANVELLNVEIYDSTIQYGEP